MNLYYFHLQWYLPFITLNKINLLFYFSSIYLLKKLRLKNNLSKYNKRLRDIITKKTNMIIKSYIKNDYEKIYST